MAKYLIVRPPSTQEDEGRHFLCGSADNRREAFEKAAALTKECNGYYSHEVYRRVVRVSKR